MRHAKIVRLIRECSRESSLAERASSHSQLYGFNKSSIGEKQNNYILLSIFNIMENKLLKSYTYCINPLPLCISLWHVRLEQDARCTLIDFILTSLNLNMSNDFEF
jgi:hypothetical protein